MSGKISKAPGARANTWRLNIRGLSVSPDTMEWHYIQIDTMFSSEGGETLSFYDPTTKQQIVLPFGEIERLAAHARAAREGGGTN